MSRHCVCSALAIFLTTALCFAAGENAKSTPKSGEVVVHFHDGSTLRRVVLQDNIELEMKYGKVIVPVADVRRIEFGFRLSDETARRVEQLIKQLGSDKFADRELATSDLVLLGRSAYPALLEAAKSTDKEVAVRAGKALEQVREAVPEEELRFRADDLIQTRECVLVGRIQAASLKARTEYLGEVQLKLADLRAVESMTVTQAAMPVDAAQFGKTMEKWHDTGLLVVAGDGLLITASGQVDITPHQPGQHVTGPEGYSALNDHDGYKFGTLLGRIGEKGEVFVIGKRFEARLQPQGKLYVQIVAGPGDSGATGSYKVNVSAGPELARNTKNGSAVSTSLLGPARGATTGDPFGTPPPPEPPVVPPPPAGSR